MTSKIAIIASCISSLLLLSGCSRTNHPADVEYDHSISPYHRVSKGESISTIARKFNMDKMALVRLNGLKPPYKIFVGQKLLVKTSATSAKPSGEIFDAPAISSPEMKGDVEVKTLEPIKGTEPMAQTQLPAQPSSEIGETAATPDVDVDSDIDDDAAEKKVDEPQNKVKAFVPNSAGSYSWPVKGKIIKGFKSWCN